jgi:DNA-binding NtrC family response regulator
MRVLIVDDNLDTLGLFAAMLGARAHVPRCVTSVAAAREVLERAAFDLVLTDLAMPGENGLALVRHVVATRPELPIVVVSGCAEYGPARAAASLGALDYLQKPIVMEDLERLLSRVHCRRQLQMPRLARAAAAELSAVATTRLVQFAGALTAFAAAARHGSR